MSSAAPHVTIVIPVYNEEAILSASIVDLSSKIRLSASCPGPTRLSSRRTAARPTVDIANRSSPKTLSRSFDVLSSDEPNYGKALKRMGILEATRHESSSATRSTSATSTSTSAPLPPPRRGLRPRRRLQGAWSAPPTSARPSASRRLLRSMNWMLWLATGFEGTDTHGLKAFKRAPPCSSSRVHKLRRRQGPLRQRARHPRRPRRSVRVKSRSPSSVHREARAPSIGLFRRVPNVLKGIGPLFYVDPHPGPT
jgi:hypothetical protein